MFHSMWIFMFFIVPRQAGVPDPPSNETWLSERKGRERKFLEQLFDLSKVDSYQIKVPIIAELRKYQQV